MRNILDQKPTLDISGRLNYSLKYVHNKDIKNKSILDIGCGFGWCELHFLKKGAKKVAGIEITEEDLKAAKNSITHKNAEFIVGSAIDIPYPDNSFDTVVAWEVIEHIPKDTEHKMFAEVQRVLQPGGAFYLSTPYNHPITNFFDPAWWLIGHRHYSKYSLNKFAEDNGLTLVHFEVKAGIWTILSVLNLYFAKWIFRRDRFWKEFFLQKENEEYMSKSSGIFNVFVTFHKKK